MKTCVTKPTNEMKTCVTKSINENRQSGLWVVTARNYQTDHTIKKGLLNSESVCSMVRHMLDDPDGPWSLKIESQR